MNRKVAAAVLIFAGAVCAGASGHAAHGLFFASRSSAAAASDAHFRGERGAQNSPAQQPQKPAAQNPPQNAQKPLQTAPNLLPNSAPAQTAAQPAPALRRVVIDPGHGGADSGARGANGTEEKDVVMDFAREVGDALRAKGFSVVMTRIADVDPSLDDRDAVANAQQDAIFISLHVGSSGPPSTVHTYTYLFPSPPGVNSAPSNANAGAQANSSSAAARAAFFASESARVAKTPPAPPNFIPWRQAQKPYLAQSRKLGDLIQVEMAQAFPGSPEISSSAPVAVLRSVTAPAVAVEVSSIGEDPTKLEAMSAGFANAIANAVTAYQAIYPPGGQ